jgi:hypothetical protein
MENDSPDYLNIPESRTELIKVGFQVQLYYVAVSYLGLLMCSVYLCVAKLTKLKEKQFHITM